MPSLGDGIHHQFCRGLALTLVLSLSPIRRMLCDEVVGEWWWVVGSGAGGGLWWFVVVCGGWLFASKNVYMCIVIYNTVINLFPYLSSCMCVYINIYIYICTNLFFLLVIPTNLLYMILPQSDVRSSLRGGTPNLLCAVRCSLKPEPGSTERLEQRTARNYRILVYTDWGDSAAAPSATSALYGPCAPYARVRPT